MNWSVSNGVFTALLMLVGYGLITLLKLRPNRITSLCCVLALVGVVLYGAIPRRTGWPEPLDELPDEFTFITGIVREPTSKQPGAIWVVIRDKDGATPKTVELPYQPGMARDVKRLAEITRVKNAEIPVSTHNQPIKKTVIKTA